MLYVSTHAKQRIAQRSTLSVAQQNFMLNYISQNATKHKVAQSKYDPAKFISMCKMRSANNTTHTIAAICNASAVITILPQDDARVRALQNKNMHNNGEFYAL